MALVYLLSSNRVNHEIDYPKEVLLNSYTMDDHRKHQVTLNRDEADLILFWSNTSRCKLHEFNLSKQEKKRTIVYNSTDSFYIMVWNGFKVLSPSWVSTINSNGICLGWNYYHPGSSMQSINKLDHPRNYKYLWSFMGSVNTHLIRKKISKLDCTDSFFKDTATQFNANIKSLLGTKTLKDYQDNYISILKDSAFVLCPRGVSPSSIRLFEVMKAGRVPVIISDEWLPPPLIDWNSCSVWIKEAEINSISGVLQEKKWNAKTMGDNARKEWERVFSDRNLFHCTIESALKLKKESQGFNRFHYMKSVLMYAFKTKSILNLCKEFYRVNFK
jgi:hypothetical protein